MKTLLFLLMFLPFLVKAQVYQIYPVDKRITLNDTIKIVMLVSDTSTVKGKPGYQDTRPFKMDGYRTKKGEFLDMYKQRLSKDIIMWIAYKVK